MHTNTILLYIFIEDENTYVCVYTYVYIPMYPCVHAYVQFTRTKVLGRKRVAIISLPLYFLL